MIETVAAVEAKFGDILPGMQWVNFGGGHHITKPGYDIPALVRCIRRFKEQYNVEIYLEPGEAVALNAGYLTTRCDRTSWITACPSPFWMHPPPGHMPDVLEMPYRPPLRGADQPGEKPYTVRLTGPTCLAGDVIGDYAFDQPLCPGDMLVFEDMAIYTMVKNNTFNGMPLPGIALLQADGAVRLVKAFGYGAFKNRLS